MCRKNNLENQAFSFSFSFSFSLFSLLSFLVSGKSFFSTLSNLLIVFSSPINFFFWPSSPAITFLYLPKMALMVVPSGGMAFRSSSASGRSAAPCEVGDLRVDGFEVASVE